MTKKNAAAPESCEGCPCDGVDKNVNPDCPPDVWCLLQRAITKGQIIDAIECGHGVLNAGKDGDCLPMQRLFQIKLDIEKIKGGG